MVTYPGHFVAKIKIANRLPPQQNSIRFYKSNQLCSTAFVAILCFVPVTSRNVLVKIPSVAKPTQNSPGTEYILLNFVSGRKLIEELPSTEYNPLLGFVFGIE